MKTPRRLGSSHKSVLLFLVRCFAYWGLALWGVGRFKQIEEWGTGLTLATLQIAFRAVGQQVHRVGSTLSVGGANVEIVSDCSPHMPFLIFGAVILAFPSSWRRRLLGLVLGAVAIHLFNTLRIITLIWILRFEHSWFEFAHVYLWQTGTVLMVFATFALWMRTLPPRREPA